MFLNNLIFPLEIYIFFNVLLSDHQRVLMGFNFLVFIIKLGFKLAITHLIFLLIKPHYICNLYMSKGFL